MNPVFMLPPPLRLLVEEFREWLLNSGQSHRTVKEYPEGVEPFLAFLIAQEMENVRSVTAAHLQAYQGLLMEKQWRGKSVSLSTVVSYLTKAKTFFRFLMKTGKIYHDPAASLELPRRGRMLPRGILTEKEVLALLEAPDVTTPIGLRDRAILELLYSCGIRNTELRYLTVQDVDLKDRTVHVHGKGNQEALVPIGKEASAALEAYVLTARPKLLQSYSGARKKSDAALLEEAGQDILFVTKNGHRIDMSNLCHLLKRYAKAADLEGNVSPHGLRHTCATHLLRRGADIRHIQKLLRHVDISSTQIYTRVAIDDLKEAQAKFHPRERAR
jgi:integrase/recombinase XerD